MRQFAQKHSQTRREQPANFAGSRKEESSQRNETPAILSFQRTIGNQAVLRMLRARRSASDSAISAATPSRTGHDFSRVSILPRSTAFEALQIGSPSDTLEQEADRTADRVMKAGPRSGDDSPVRQVSDARTLRRTTYSPYSLSEGMIVEDDEEPVQRKPGAAVTAAPGVTARVETVVRRSGAALPNSTQTFMESRFGHDFSRVRIHADESAAQAAESVNARAFTKGAAIVFARGQYSPHSQAGRWLLAHELTHVIQQQQTPTLTGDDLPGRDSGSNPAITSQDRSSTLRRVKWDTARDTGKDSFPWGSGPKGDVYEVETDSGRKINAWKPHNGTTYWCHGYTFGGAAAAGGPFSIWGESVPKVLQDDGWKNTWSCMAQSKDILVFSANNVAHSGIIHSVISPGAVVDESASKLDSKWGQASLNRNSWEVNAKQYGSYEAFSKAPLVGVCADKGPNER